MQWTRVFLSTNSRPVSSKSGPSHLRKLPTIYPVETYRPVFVSFPIYDILPPTAMVTPTLLISDYQVHKPITNFLCFSLCFISSLQSRLSIWPCFLFYAFRCPLLQFHTYFLLTSLENCDLEAATAILKYHITHYATKAIMHAHFGSV
jgi:hypothetical protein